MKNKTAPHITWKPTQSAKDYLCAKEFEFNKALSDQRAINWKYKIEK
jgi:hypothetical protein